VIAIEVVPELLLDVPERPAVLDAQARVGVPQIVHANTS
jgi:hypothetical protein